MKRLLVPMVALFLFAGGVLLAEDQPAAPVEIAPQSERPPAEKKVPHSKSMNIDMKVIYGQYNSMLSAISLSQEQENFVYLLSSSFRRSNDFGYNGEIYENSSYYQNNLGFTGNLQVSDRYRFGFDAEVNGESRGMFDNTVYSREEQEKAKLSVKNTFRFSPSFEGFCNIGGAQYVHRLRPIGTVEDGNSRLNQANIEAGGEYIWSPTNRVRFNSNFYGYFYSDSQVRDDRFVDSEVIDDFYITRNIGFSLGANFDYNRDDTYLFSPIISFLIKDYRSASIILSYRYDMVPFRPEIFYLQQKYIMPTYDLPPSRVHHGDLRMEFRLNSFLELKSVFVAEHCSAFYNYYPVTGNLLSADTVRLALYQSKIDINLYLFDRLLECSLGCEYSLYDADVNITYHPVHMVSGGIRYNGDAWKILWMNRYRGEVYVDPASERQIGGSIVGEFSIQRKMLESFYGYIRIENLYNSRYYLRDGYPEQGISVLGGVRILI